MKKFIVLALILINSICNAQFIDKDYTQIAISVNPLLKDNSFQIGGEIQKIMHWGYAAIGASVHKGYGIAYSDLIGTFGVNFHLFNNDIIRYYGGLRGGLIWMETNPYPMAGSVIGFDARISKYYSKTQFHIGIRLWIDYREDQKTKFYGNTNTYEKGIITNNPQLQESRSIIISMSW